MVLPYLLLFDNVLTNDYNDYYYSYRENMDDVDVINTIMVYYINISTIYDFSIFLTITKIVPDLASIKRREP